MDEISMFKMIGHAYLGHAFSLNPSIVRDSPLALYLDQKLLIFMEWETSDEN